MFGSELTLVAMCVAFDIGQQCDRSIGTVHTTSKAVEICKSDSFIIFTVHNEEEQFTKDES